MQNSQQAYYPQQQATTAPRYYATPRGYYPYPSNYQGNSPKKQSFNPKLIYPAILILMGLALVGYNFVKVQKMDSRLLRLSPDTEVAVVVFCDPCTGISGERVSSGKMLVADRVSKILLLGSLNNVKQIQYLYPLN